MNRADMLEVLSASGGISKAQAGIALQSLFDASLEALKRGERITISGLGTLAPSQRRARMGRNPRTGELLRIDGRRSVRFRAGLELRKAMDAK